MYYGRDYGVARVLQLLAHPEWVGSVVDSLVTHAYRLGCVALRGRVQLRLLDAL